MSRCDVVIVRGLMSEARQCIKDKGHRFRHTPDLIGMVFSHLIVKRRGRPIGENNMTVWIVADIYNGKERAVRAASLLNGSIIGKDSLNLLSRHKPEYNTVQNHWKFVFDPRNPAFLRYKDMPFCDDWNPRKGGDYRKGVKWILENLGKRPGPEWSMDIIEHAKGFMPGNLRWAKRSIQTLNQQHRILGKWTDEEFEVEARKRGYILTKCQLSKKPDNETHNESPQVAQQERV